MLLPSGPTWYTCSSIFVLSVKTNPCIETTKVPNSRAASCAPFACHMQFCSASEKFEAGYGFSSDRTVLNDRCVTCHVRGEYFERLKFRYP